MAEEKRVKLGVDVGELSNQLVQINNTIEQNYQKALQGQSEYNKILESSIDLLQRQADLVSQLGQQNQPSTSIVPQSQPIEGGSSESKLNELIEGILADVDAIWEKFSSLTIPIPVEVTNIPLGVTTIDSGGSSSGTTTSDGTSRTDTDSRNNGGSGGSSNSTKGSSNVVGQGANILASGASDPNYLIAGLAGMIPVVGSAVASVLNKAIGEGEQKIKSAAVFRGATGGNMPFVSLHNIGLKDAEAYLKEAQYYPANINLSLKDLQFEKGYNISGGTIDSLLRAMREDVIQERYGTSSAELGVTYLSQLRGEGQIDPKKIRGYTEDYLKILIDLNQKQLETTGETNSIISGEVVANIAKTSEKFGDPTVLQRVIQGIQGGLTQAPSAQAEALQYWAMSQANPNANIWQMELMRENPFSEEARGYFANYVNALLQTGNAIDVRFNIKEALGLTAHQTEEFLSGINTAKTKSEDYYSRVSRGEILTEEERKEYEELQRYLINGKFDLTNYLEGVDAKGLTSSDTFWTDATSQIEKEAISATSENEILLAQASDRLASIGEPIIKYTNLAIEKTGEVVDMLGKFFDTGLNGVLHDFWNDIKSEIKELIFNKVGNNNPNPQGIRTNSIDPNSINI